MSSENLMMSAGMRLISNLNTSPVVQTSSVKDILIEGDGVIQMWTKLRAFCGRPHLDFILLFRNSRWLDTNLQSYYYPESVAMELVTVLMS